MIVIVINSVSGEKNFFVTATNKIWQKVREQNHSVRTCMMSLLVTCVQQNKRDYVLAGVKNLQSN